MLAGLPVTGESQRALRIRIGTAVPQGSIWHEVILQMEQDWESIAEGQVEVAIYPGGTQGDEATMLDSVRINGLQAVALSGAGLAQVDTGVSALQIPMLFSSYEELDYVWERMAPVLEERLEAKGFILLNWGDVGWVRFFTKEPARTPDDIRATRLFTSAGDPETERLYRRFGFNPVPTAVTDMVTNLLTGLINAFDVPPLFALADQSFSLASHMLDLKWAPLVGATLIRKDTWEQIPENLRSRFLSAARNASESRREEIRALGDSSIAAMKENDLQVTPVDDELEAIWRSEAEDIWDEIRGGIVPEELFDQALRLRNEFRRIEGLIAEARETDDPEELQRIYSMILELDPTHEAAIIGLIGALMAIAEETDETEALRQIYTRVLRLDPDHEDAAAALEAIEESNGR